MAHTDKDSYWRLQEQIDPEYRLRPGHKCQSLKEDRKLAYWGPERALRRRMMTHFTREAAHGDTTFDDSLAPMNQHRHAMFGHGWWD